VVYYECLTLPRELHSFDTEMHLKRVLQLSMLVQIDKSRVDSRRLSLVFTEAIATQVRLPTRVVERVCLW
jgi:hypothetical protein